MNTEEFFVEVVAHFLTNYKGGETARQLFENYAKEELKMSETDAIDFSNLVEKGTDVKDMQDELQKQRFYLWYYINYMKVKP